MAFAVAQFKQAAASNLTFTNPTTAGNMIAAIPAWGDKTTNANTPTEVSGHDTFASCGKSAQTAGVDSASVQIFYAKNIHGGTAEQVDQSASLPGLDNFICEISGADTVAPFDSGSFCGAGGVGSTASATGTAAASGELVLGGCYSPNGNTSTAGTGFALMGSISGGGTGYEQGTLGSSGSYTATFHMSSSSDEWVVGFCAFKAAGGAAASSIGYVSDDPRPRAPAKLSSSQIESGAPFSATAPFVSSSHFASSYPDEPRHQPTTRAPRLEDQGPIDATKTILTSWGPFEDRPAARAIAIRPAPLAEQAPLTATKPNLGSSWGDFDDAPPALVARQRPLPIPDAWPVSPTKPSLGSSWGAFSDEAPRIPAKHPRLEDTQPIDATKPNLGSSWGFLDDSPSPRVLFARPAVLPEPQPLAATRPNLGSSWGAFDDPVTPLVTRARPQVLPEPSPLDGLRPIGSGWGAFDDAPPPLVAKQRPAVLPEPWAIDATRPNLGSSWGAFSDEPVARATKARPAVLAEPLPLGATKPNLGSSWGVFADDVVPAVTRARPGPSTEAWVPPRLSLPTLANSGWWDGANWLPSKPPKPIPEGPGFDAVTVIVLPHAGWMADEPARRQARPRAPDEASPWPTTSTALAKVLLVDEPARPARPRRGPAEELPPGPTPFPLAHLALADDVARPHAPPLRPEEWLPLRPWRSGLPFLGADDPIPVRRPVAAPMLDLPLGPVNVRSSGWLADEPIARHWAPAALALDLPFGPLAARSFGWLADEPARRSQAQSRSPEEWAPLTPAAIVVLPSIGWIGEELRRAPVFRGIVWLDDGLALGPSVRPGIVRTTLREYVFTNTVLREILVNAMLARELP